jgi:hypothetical protein
MVGGVAWRHMPAREASYRIQVDKGLSSYEQGPQPWLDGTFHLKGNIMSKLMYEIEITSDGKTNYIYLETDSDISIGIGYIESNPLVTHVAMIDTDMGLDADLIIKREV